MNILLDYFFPITAIEPTPAASTGFLKQALILVKPKGGVTPGTITLATSMSQVAAITDNTEAQQLFNAGMSRVYVLAMATLDIDTVLAGHESDFFTILVSSDFTDSDVTAADFGLFEGVVGVSSVNGAFLIAQAAIKNRSAFRTTSGTKAKNMFFAFGKFLSNQSNWRNQQYISMPFADDVNTLGAAEQLFDDRISFVLSDTQYGNRLALFVAGGKAIFAPYVIKNLMIDMQSRALTYVSGNQPTYTPKNAALLEDEVSKVMDRYIERELIETGSVEIELGDDGFTALGDIEVAAPKALWRITAELRQT